MGPRADAAPAAASTPTMHPHDVELFVLHREECATVRLAPDPHDPELHEAPFGSFDELQYSLRRGLQLQGGEHITALRTFEEGHEVTRAQVWRW